MNQEIEVSPQHILWKKVQELQAVVLTLALVVELNKDSKFIIIEKHNSPQDAAHIVAARLD